MPDLWLRLAQPSFASRAYRANQMITSIVEKLSSTGKANKGFVGGRM
jgi:hypothetical protein